MLVPFPRDEQSKFLYTAVTFFAGWKKKLGRLKKNKITLEPEV